MFSQDIQWANRPLILRRSVVLSDWHKETVWIFSNTVIKACCAVNVLWPQTNVPFTLQRQTWTLAECEVVLQKVRAYEFCTHFNQCAHLTLITPGITCYLLQDTHATHHLCRSSKSRVWTRSIRLAYRQVLRVSNRRAGRRCQRVENDHDRC